MGFGGIGVTELLLILAIVALLFGTKKLRNIGEDLGGAIKGFKNAMSKGEAEGREPDGRAAERIEAHTADDGLAPRATTKARQDSDNAS